MSKKLKMAEDSGEEAKPHQMELETDMIVQKAAQAVANRYEAEIKRLKRFHEKEMETLIKGRKSMIKPSLWARITEGTRTSTSFTITECQCIVTGRIARQPARVSIGESNGLEPPSRVLWRLPTNTSTNGGIM